MLDKQIRLLGFVKITGEIEALTGLHIGGTEDSIDKGGIDSPVIKNPVTNEPYIPGSSIRGRMRSLLEIGNGRKLTEMTKGIWLEIYRTEEASFSEQEFTEILSKISDYTAKEKLNKNVRRMDGSVLIKLEKIKKLSLPKDIIDIEKVTKNAQCRAYNSAIDSPVCRVFGNSESDPPLPSVLIVRDALLSEYSKKHGYMYDGKLPVTEAKIEIVIDRITGQAMPRTIERVPAGATFDFEIIYKVQTHENGQYADDAPDPEIKCNRKLREDLTNILWALDTIENHAGLGGNTARGHGQVRFKYQTIEVSNVDPKNCEVKCTEPKGLSYKAFNDAVNSISFTIKSAV